MICDLLDSRGDLHVAPFTDEALYMEQFNKVNFWYQEYFHGVNLSCLRSPVCIILTVIKLLVYMCLWFRP